MYGQWQCYFYSRAVTCLFSGSAARVFTFETFSTSSIVYSYAAAVIQVTGAPMPFKKELGGAGLTRPMNPCS